MPGTDVRELGTYAMIIAVAAMVITMGALVLSELRPQTLETLSINDEEHDYSEVGTLPSNITLNTVQDGVTEVTKGVWEDADASTNTTLTAGTDYELMDEDTGQVQIYDSSNLTDYDSTADSFYFDYNYENSTTATSSVDSAQEGNETFGDFLPIISLVAAAAIIMAILLSHLGGIRR